MKRRSTSTYRLQLHAGFRFADAAFIIPYLARLGISHLYLSPILEAVSGSMHGYDVIDHTKISSALGGESALLELSRAAHAHEIGIVVDVVPNHMAIPAQTYLNPPLWKMLRDGQRAATAHWFDVEWAHGGGKLALPMLGKPLDETIAAGELVVSEHDGEPVLRYGENCFPLAPESRKWIGGDLRSLLAAQHYALFDWRKKAETLNYRRFFDVDTLIAIRVEIEEVFEKTHAKLLELRARGILDGFRVDHPDGLADPQGYLERLHERSGDAWILVEKILGRHEKLPRSWLAAGTTGYDAIAAVQSALVPNVGTALDARWKSAGGEPSFAVTELRSKRDVIESLFGAEVARLARSAVIAARESGDAISLEESKDALAELLAHIDVYRIYLRLGISADEKEENEIAALAEKAKISRPDLANSLAILQRLLLNTMAVSDAARDLVIRFQQVCGPVMAKGVEDTTFYRWNRMIALNEVGGDPEVLDDPTVENFHRWCEYQAQHYPHGMTCLSTHDTKRNEDARTRLFAAAENLDGWNRVADAVLREAKACEVDEPTAYFFAQTLLGSWPLAEERLCAYARKAIREAKEQTNWISPNESYELRVEELMKRCLAEPVVEILRETISANHEVIRATTLVTKLVQLTMPGIPDIYQGTEFAEPTLVDPDNRRPINYLRREETLAKLNALDEESLFACLKKGDDLDAAKMILTNRTLRFRREHPELFDERAGYRPLVSGSPHLLGFLRAERLATVVTRWPGKLARDGWRGASVNFPSGIWRDLFTNERHEIANGEVACRELLRELPFALLLRE